MNASVIGKFIVGGVLAGGLLLAFAAAGRAESPPAVRINPASMQVYTGDTGRTDIEVSAINPAAARLTLTFNPALITVIDDEPGRDGIQVAINPVLLAQGAAVEQNQVDTAAGQIVLKITHLPQPLPAAQLASITWLGLTEGVANIDLISAELTGPTGQPVTPTIQNSVIEVTAAQPGAIFGRILLQGRRQHNGVSVVASERACPEPPATLRSSASLGTTNPDGYFEFVPAAGLAYRCVQVLQHGYLAGQAGNPKGNLGTLELPGGDINDDNAINIFDMAYIGSHYGDNDPQVDINGDGTVSIFDLVLAASNYGRQGPVSQWQ
ncbi:MAG: hypothetical protein FOGNACKC_00643 [Anaerolineae bacterium]|nr:hypothetical protein [Anaerolineae bacterium]